MLALVLGVVACGDELPVEPGTLRFGQIGEARVLVVTPLRLGVGELRQTLVWVSEGPWELTESIWYRGVLGDQNIQRSVRSPEALASSYALWIAQVNDVQASKLFIEELDPDLEPVCGVTRSRVSVAIRDVVRGEEVEWIRCADGSLETLLTFGAGPGETAARVVSAAILARNFSVLESFPPVYSGSVPFATLERGDETNAELIRSRVISNQLEWDAFWKEHRSPEAEPPEVDFGEDMVVVGAVGLRTEAGDTVEVRRVLTVGAATRVEIVERVPGDFCAPAELDHFPFHMVLVPVVPLPVTFNDVAVERVPCGR